MNFSHPTAFESLCDNVKKIKPKNLVYDFCPALKWVPEYSIRKYLMSDFISGFTVAIMHIPQVMLCFCLKFKLLMLFYQGMAYALLAGVPSIMGLYMAFFPLLIYFLFGTSKHISMGTFAVISIMTSKIVATYSDPNYGVADALNSTSSEGEETAAYPYSSTQVATAVSMVCGIYHIIMCVLRMGILSSLLSEALVNGFTTAAGTFLIRAGIVLKLYHVKNSKLPCNSNKF